MTHTPCSRNLKYEAPTALNNFHRKEAAKDPLVRGVVILVMSTRFPASLCAFWAFRNPFFLKGAHRLSRCSEYYADYHFVTPVPVVPIFAPMNGFVDAAGV